MVCWYGSKGGVRFTVAVNGGVYGIFARQGEEEAGVPDISPDRQAVRCLARACARAQLEPCHLRDAAEDWLADTR